MNQNITEDMKPREWEIATFSQLLSSIPKISVEFEWLDNYLS